MANFLVSYPRSGNTWLRYCIELVTGLPTTSFVTKKAISNIIKKHDAVGVNIIKNINLQKPAVLIKRHHFYNHWCEGVRCACHCDLCQYKLTDKDSIVLLIRDYKESIFRHILPELSNLKDWHLFDNINRYMDLIYLYDRFEGNKVIIYYEDLITDTISEIKKVCKFLNIFANFDDLSNNLETHRKKTLYKYGQSVSGGNKIVFHAQNVNSKILQLLDSTIVKDHIDIRERYLSRYI